MPHKIEHCQRVHILIIEDENKTAAAIEQGLEEAGYDVTVARRGDEGLLLAKTRDFDLILLDIMLPYRDGWEILHQLRSRKDRPPVICLTARDAVDDRVRGLELGADDYLVKPFVFLELLARVRTVLRRSIRKTSGRLDVADLGLDLVRQRAVRRGKQLDLTPKEFALLAFLVEHREEVLPRSMIASAVWGMPLAGESNVIDVSVRRLRAKVDDPFPTPLIHTVRGIGYVLRQG